MRRGTAPTHTFFLEGDYTGSRAVQITYKQRERIILQKTLQDVSMSYDEDDDETVMGVTLTAEETMRFDTGAVNVQVRIVKEDGTPVASRIRSILVTDVLDRKVDIDF